MKTEYWQGKTVEIIRWVALFPISISCGILSHYIIVMFNMIAVELNAYPGSFFAILIVRCVGNFCLGAVSVTIASVIAPYYKRQLTFLMAGILTTASCFFLVISLFTADYKAMLAAVSISIGSVFSAFIIIKRKNKSSKLNPYLGS